MKKWIVRLEAEERQHPQVPHGPRRSVLLCLWQMRSGKHHRTVQERHRRHAHVDRRAAGQRCLLDGRATGRVSAIVAVGAGSAESNHSLGVEVVPSGIRLHRSQDHARGSQSPGLPGRFPSVRRTRDHCVPAFGRDESPRKKSRFADEQIAAWPPARWTSSRLQPFSRAVVMTMAQIEPARGGLHV